MVKKLYLEDFFPGQTFRTGTITVTAEDIKTFAAAYDPQPFHLDEEAARDTFFGELVASGWHTAALTMRLFVEGELQIAGGIIGGGGEVKWPAPLRPGDTVTVEIEVKEVKPSSRRPDRGTIVVHSRTLTTDGRVVQDTTVTLIALRKGAEA